jgi:hypothetical protein
MFTSYFGFKKWGYNPNVVAICRYIPKWYTGRTYSSLAPSKDLLMKWRMHKDEDEYEAIYYRETLSKLNPLIVYEDLKDSILLCYEPPEEFCHRHLVAQWLNENTDEFVSELA